MTEPDVLEQIETLVEEWEEGSSNVKNAYVELKDHLFDREDTLF